MEIKFSHVKTDVLDDVSFTIPSGVITGISGDGMEMVLKTIAFGGAKGIICYDKIRKTKKNEEKLEKDICYLPMIFQKEFPFDKVEEYYRSFFYSHKIKTSSMEEKIKGAIKIVGLEESILKRNFSDLSSSEIKLIQFSLAFLENPKVLLLEEPFIFFDEATHQKIIRVLEKLKDKFHKTVVIASNNQNLLYQDTKYLILLKDGKLLMEDMSENVYYCQKDSVKNKIKLPKIVEFIQYVEQKKGVKLDRRKDVKDVMKDIYRNV